jgi:hypothetical protein
MRTRERRLPQRQAIRFFPLDHEAGPASAVLVREDRSSFRPFRGSNRNVCYADGFYPHRASGQCRTRRRPEPGRKGVHFSPAQATVRLG